MLIRCEKCNTLYELDEKLLPPTGAPVQCSKCQFVFKAYPNARDDVPPANEASAAKDESAPTSGEVPTTVDGEEAAELQVPAQVPSATNPASTGVRRAPSAAAAEAGGMKPQATTAKKPGPTSGAAPSTDEPQFTADGRPIRKVPFPTEEPAPMGPRPPMARVQGRATVPAKARRWAVVVVPVALALVLAAAFVAWWVLSRRSPPAAARQRAEGHSLLLRGVPPGPPWGTPPFAPACSRPGASRV